jgi:serine/threonine protein kinase
MEERYEIKGKIGQGGLGAVYRAHDIRMNREVAIKRILTNSEDSSNTQEATRQLVQEAGALASLQHPNIVTVYDVGTDEDGPFVVMELLTGDTVEDLIAKGSFTWLDFRQLAMQTLEALIAAQELHLVHRDLKPGNIMLTWLPSGKFQVKIVDFGLAKLSAKPSLQTIDQSDGVFGSIYFMAPEQFERVPIDLKADLYAIGCVFYYALTGTYPFDGETAAEVMAAHLQHQVTPLQEVREGIPIWACDWIMWHLNRQPSDRPDSARQALKVFLENDESSSPFLSTGKPAAAPDQPKRPRLVIPGSAPVPELVKESIPNQSVKTATIPKALAPPDSFKPSVHTTAQVLLSSVPEGIEAPAAESPQENHPNLPPPAEEIAKPVLASSILKRAAAPATAVESNSKTKLAPTGKLKPPGSATATATPAALPHTLPSPKKKGLSNAMKIAIAAILGILAVGLAVLLLKKSGENAEAKLYNEMINQATVSGATEVLVDKRKLEILLRSVTDIGANDKREAIYTALYLAKSTDGTDVDARIVECATTQEMVPNIRTVLIRDVLRKRNNPAIIGNLLKFSRSTNETSAAVAAIEATRFMSTDTHFKEFIDIIRTTKEDQILKEAEKNAEKIIDKSPSKAGLLDSLISTYESAPNDTVRHTTLRLLGRIGGEKAMELVRKNLDSTEEKNMIAAIGALGAWSDKEGYTTLIEFLKSATDLEIRSRAFKSAFEYASQSEDQIQENWTLLTAEAKTQEEQLLLIRGLVGVPPAPWVYEILQNFNTSSDYDDVIDLAERATDKLKDIESIQNKSDDEE